VLPIQPPAAPARRSLAAASNRILVFGASAGGTGALKEVLVQLPPDCPGIVIAQHMPEHFTHTFATRLDDLCQIKVKEAEHGDIILPGHAYLAPGDAHLLIARSGAHYVCELSQGEAVNRHRPSVDVLFRSAAQVAGRHAIGVIFTGMGKDGAAGLNEMHKAGAHTVAQDEASCMVFGMPREAIAQGGVDQIVALHDIAKYLLDYLEKNSGSRSPATRPYYDSESPMQ
jgi:two-component system chemotaxis response regulator CheB